MLQLNIFGKASNKTIAKLLVRREEMNLSLLNFLQQHQIPIASSCFGEGYCKRCIINHDLLSCQTSVQDFIARKHTSIIIDYL